MEILYHSNKRQTAGNDPELWCENCDCRNPIYYHQYHGMFCRMCGTEIKLEVQTKRGIKLYYSVWFFHEDNEVLEKITKPIAVDLKRFFDATKKKAGLVKRQTMIRKALLCSE